ncbi:PREDICTED: uncharacterized protein LOC103090205 [Lipotes vexillifer]|uniref:Uncharacterized protein LOC103090205 n=1 Tax=Lipotes vexillifer TaxID=118797 RepID=A0A340WUL3_LIPVE|nr:PREDICTED: uncharacterized protein LOC103090205 [Lipotes vexillifer]
MARGVGDPCPRRMQVEPGQKLLSSAPAPSAYPNPVKKSVSQDPVRLPNLQQPIRNTSHVIADESGFGIIPQDPEKLVPELRPQLTEIVQATQRRAKARRRAHELCEPPGELRAGQHLAPRAPLRTAPCGLPGSWRLGFQFLNAALKSGAVKVTGPWTLKIFILQLVELVLTYNFTDCDFKNIKDIYQDIIHPELNVYINGTKSIRFNKFVYCEDAPDCLIKIEHFTFKPIYGCASLAKETFAKQTNATLSLGCSGYSGIQINNTQTMKKRRKREVKTDKCLEQVSYLIELWRRFSRIS